VTKSSFLAMVWYNRVILYFDGAPRSNPRGPAGCGWVLKEMDENGADSYYNIASSGDYLGYNVSNNQAEYQGLINRLKYILNNISCSRVYVRGDSEIVIRQMTGEYNVNSNNIRPYHNDAKEIEDEMYNDQNVDVYHRHISRNRNWEADQLANSAIDDYRY
jgi:ribonuclease HI